jgi:hypothetical protein
MTQPELFAPLDFADLVAPRQMWGKPLFEHLASRFDYILQLGESSGGMWSVWIWYAETKTHPGELGIRGELGSLGWTHEPVTFGAAVGMADDAAKILKKRGLRHVAVFSPGEGWRARVRALRASAALLSGGAA